MPVNPLTNIQKWRNLIGLLLVPMVFVAMAFAAKLEVSGDLIGALDDSSLAAQQFDQFGQDFPQGMRY